MIETLVALAVIGIFFTSIATIVQVVIEQIALSRIQVTALALARETIEEARNLPYLQIGTVGGIPNGPLPQSRTETINSQVFTVTTSVVYIDDPFDGLAPADMINTDYKRVRVQVRWTGPYQSREPVTLVTNFVPKGVETVEGGGTLLVQVFDSAGLPVSNATVNIDNTSVVPPIHTTTLTSATGTVVIPGAPACVLCYRITASKATYSSDRTYSPSEVTNPILPDLTVIEGQLSQASLAIDKTSTIKIDSVNQAMQPIANVYFTLRGAKLIGHDATDESVYKYEYRTNTGGSTVTIVGLEWDVYTLDFTDSAHMLAGSSPLLPYLLPAGTNGSVVIVAVPKTLASYQLTVKDTLLTPQASASARLLNVPLGYDKTVITAATGSASYGQAYFGSLGLGQYSVSVNLPGFQEATTSVTISGNQRDTIILNPYVPIP